MAIQQASRCNSTAGFTHRSPYKCDAKGKPAVLLKDIGRMLWKSSHTEATAPGCRHPGFVYTDTGRRSAVDLLRDDVVLEECLSHSQTTKSTLY